MATGDHYEAADVKGIPKRTAYLSRMNKVPGWVGDFGKKEEDQIIWTVKVDKGGKYTLKFLYGHNNDSHPEGKLTVNGKVASTLLFDQKTGWGNPVAVKEVQADLSAGENKVILQLNTNHLWLNVDSLTVSDQEYSQEYEAEHAELISCKVDQVGHVGFFETDGDYIQFDVEVPSTGDYPLIFGYAIDRTEVIRNLYVNGTRVKKGLRFPATGGSDLYDQKEETVQLKKGKNTIVIKAEGVNDNGMSLDYVKVGNQRLEAEKAAKIGWEPTVQPIIKTEMDESGNGMISEFKQQGDYIEFAYDSEQTGAFPLTIRYKNMGDDTKRSVYVNGQKAGVVSFGRAQEWTETQIPVYVTNGNSWIRIKAEEASTPVGIEVDRITVNGTTFEAEDARIGWEPVVAKTGGVQIAPGYTDNFGHKGQSVSFRIDVPETREYGLKFHYRSGNDPVVDILSDGKAVAEKVTFRNTPDGWGGAMVEKEVKVKLASGTHEITVKMVSEGQFMNLDNLTVDDKVYQVEDATFTPEHHGITHTVGYVHDFKDENDQLTFDVYAPADGREDLNWRYMSDSESRRPAVRALYVNGRKITDLSFTHAAGWNDLALPDIELKKGRNRIVIKVENRDDDGIKLDYLQIGSRRYHAEEAEFTPPMVIEKDTIKHFGHIGDEVTFDIHVTQPGETSFIFTYVNQGHETKRTLYIDGKPVLDQNGAPVQIAFKGTEGKFDEDAYHVVPYLAKGSHRLTLKQEPGQKGSIDLRRMTIGFFDEPSVLLMDAGLGALGATHIELGTAEKLEEGPNMLAHEYYPNRSKKMKTSLKERLKEVYKLYTAYENLLFDSKVDHQVQISVQRQDGSNVPADKNGSSKTLWYVARKNDNNRRFEHYDVLHLINLLNNDGNWQNAANKPDKLQNFKVSYPVGVTKADAPNLKVYAASPDREGGILKELKAEWKGSTLEIQVPTLEYWEMILIDRNPETGQLKS
ncbi:CBM35 domain-containing protein [Paenactinomyces guangxiensis]|uniref:Carbohydrate-binding protein n=1 Tax=Paenactinomyces guangxiensis TaxID=1490290 RepID=A0A7W1WUS5_9BACL|nr:CBM35 domain-containing protein [Paenactinomyces guangxiensis]MBA4496449.1 carbohydrate-binding protein [Paenactinomyces guangxiensis]MBH8593565.1 carbohydrate-binding protein [Paenactinomyces guangxiensis]